MKSPSEGDLVAQRLAAIVASSDDAIISKDLAGIIQTWNKAAERMFGYPASEVIGRSITIIIPDDRRQEEVDVLAQISRGASVEHFETIRRRKDGGLIEISLTVSPIRTGEGRIIGASKIARDITEHNRLRRRLEEADRLKDEFLATLSHELRTPLNAILGYARILRGKELDAERLSRGLAIIERNATALNQLVADVLDVSRIVAGKVRLNVQPCDLPTIANNAIEALGPAVAAKSLELKSVIDPSAGPVAGDPDRLQQSFWNILSNAVKFTPKHGRILVHLARVNSEVEFAVTDNGIGIAPGFAPHVFDRFRQGDSGSTREFGGLGLGLALVRHFVELHGGTVEASSEGLGKGATFRIMLPIMAAHSQANRTHPTTGGKVPRSHASLVGVSVLTLDDDPDALHLLEEILRDAGATVVAARSAEEAFDRLDEQLPDVIVADIGMPRANGYEFIGELRRRGPEQGGAIPAAALTAYARAEDRTAALVAGFQLHLAKPIDPEELLAAVHAIARHRSR